MSPKNSQSILDDINKLEEKIEKIALSNNEKYQYYMNAISELKQELYELDDERNINLGGNEVKIIQRIVELNMDFDNYLKYGEENVYEININLLDDKSISGNETNKRYRINLYRSIMEGLKRFSNIDIPKLKKLREKWEEEKKEDEIGYSPIELDIVEEEFAQLVINYQIKYLKKEETLNKGLLEYCDIQKYERVIKKRLLNVIQSKEEGTNERLDLELLYTKSDIEDILNDKSFWKAISGVDFKKINENERKEEQQEKELPAQVENNYIIPVNEKVNGKATGVMQFRIFGKTINMKLKFRMDKDGYVVVPEMLHQKIISISIGEGIREIKSNNFLGYRNLKLVYLPESLEKIGNNAFGGTAIEKISIPKNVDEIGAEAFSFCDELKEVDMSSSKVKNIQAKTFAWCNNLKDLKLPSELESIGRIALLQTALKEIELPQSLKTMDSEVFRESSIEKIELPDGLESIGELCFSKCEELKKVVVGKNLRKIERGAFYNCKNLNDVVLNEGVRVIGESAFESCSGLREITFPKSLTEIQDEAFFECYNLIYAKIKGKKSDIKIEALAFPNGVKFKKFDMPDCIERKKENQNVISRKNDEKDDYDGR